MDEPCSPLQYKIKNVQIINEGINIWKKLNYFLLFGDFECLKAAVQNGADSVYFGAANFNARAQATNFDLTNFHSR